MRQGADVVDLNQRRVASERADDDPIAWQGGQGQGRPNDGLVGRG